MVRAGIALYGVETIPNKNPMKNVMTMSAKIFAVRDVPKGEAVGYGQTQKVTRNSRIAYVAAGYADGYPRAASQSGVPMRKKQKPTKAFCKGKRINGVGRISMDMSAFDVTRHKNIKVGDWVELFGDNVKVDDLARSAGTIGYEIITKAGGRAQIVYVK